MRLLVVEQQPDAPAGLVASWAAGRGLAVTTLRPASGQPLPRPASPGDAVVVLGSEETAFDDSIPWLDSELTFVRQALEGSVPVLGICFGGQVLARVLGARVYRLAAPEIGWMSVVSKRAGLAEGPWLAWHRDGFELPEGCCELATGGASLQAFGLGPHAGLQFHPGPVVAPGDVSMNRGSGCAEVRVTVHRYRSPRRGAPWTNPYYSPRVRLPGTRPPLGPWPGRPRPVPGPVAGPVPGRPAPMTRR